VKENEVMLKLENEISSLLEKPLDENLP